MRLSNLQDALIAAGLPIESLAYDGGVGLRINYSSPPSAQQLSAAAQIEQDWPTTEAALIAAENADKVVAAAEKAGLRTQAQSAIVRLSQIETTAEAMTTAQLKTALADVARIELAMLKVLARLF